jgi:hypothetical protein
MRNIEHKENANEEQDEASDVCETELLNKAEGRT